ncbi:MAG: VWA domain-containing protein [Sandaracinus sp.]|nr:VWA domain-containing protein [Sandaracinus sp.]
MRALLLGLSLACVACGGDDRPPGTGRDGGGTPVDGATDARSLADVVLPDVPGEVCESVSAVAEPLPPTLVFQLDMSNSMNCAVTNASCLTEDPTADPNDSRWDVFRRVFLSALDTLPTGTRLGLMRFPRSEGACANDATEVAIDALSANRSSVESTVGALVPNGIGTPTHDAVRYGLGQLRADAGERPFLVLVTDGDARACLGCDNACSFDELDDDNDDMVSEVGAAGSDGVPTFVIGVPGAQGFRDVLSRMATAAGTARAGCSDTGPTYCHFDLTEPGLDFATALGDALAAIGDAVISCEYDIPENPEGAFDETKVNVRLTTDAGAEEVVPRDTSRANGWDYDDARDRVILHGDACTRAQAAMRVDVLFGCPTILI